MVDFLRGIRIPEQSNIDLDAFAMDTAHFEMPLAERFRQLAIHLENVEPGNWSMLARVYDAALRADPDEPYVLCSWALARYHASDDESVLDRCIPAARCAVSVVPSEGWFQSVLGFLLYEARLLEEAEQACRAAITLGWLGWPQLRLAHIFHDQERYAEAAKAYATVTPAPLGEHGMWRIQLAREQRAACLHRSNRRAEALELYEEVLNRYDRALDAGLGWLTSPVLFSSPPQYLLDDLEEFPELRERADALLERLRVHPDASVLT